MKKAAPQTEPQAEPQTEVSAAQEEMTAANRSPNEVSLASDTAETTAARGHLTRAIDARVAHDTRVQKTKRSAAEVAAEDQDFNLFDDVEGALNRIVSDLSRGKSPDNAPVMVAISKMLGDNAEVLAKGTPEEKQKARANIRKITDAVRESTAKGKRRVSGYSAKALTRAIKQLPFVGRMLGKKVVIVQSMADLARAMGRPPKSARVKGVFYRGRVFLVADEISNDVDAKAVLLHELGVHYGFTMDEVAKYAEEIKGWANASVGSVQRAVYDRATARVKHAGVTGKLADEELVAYAVEEAVNAGVSPASKVGSWLQRLANAVASFFGGRTMSVQDLVTYAASAAQRRTASAKSYTAKGAAAESVAESAPELKVNPVAKALRDTWAQTPTLLGQLKYYFAKVFHTLDTQLEGRLSASPALKALGRLINTASHQYVDSRNDWIAKLNVGLFGESRERLVALSHANPAVYDVVVKALQLEATRAELQNDTEMDRQLNKAVILDGKQTTGYEVLTKLRKDYQQAVVLAAKEGVFIFNSKEESLRVTSAEEPVYFPRAFDLSKIRNNPEGMVRAIADNDIIAKEMGWGKDKSARQYAARQFVDRLVTRGFDDPLLNPQSSVGLSDKMRGRADSVLKEIGTFRAEDEQLAMVVARAFSHKNRRTMSDAASSQMLEFYQRDVAQVTSSYATSLATRIATHKAFGGWVSKNYSRFVKSKEDVNQNYHNEVLAQAAQNPDKPAWWHQAHAAERLAEKGGLYYSPVAYAEYAIRRAYDENAGVENTNWIRKTYFPALFNSLGQDMDYRVRMAQDITMFGMKVPLLIGATLTSVVEVGNLGVRIANPGLGKSVVSATAKAAAEVMRLTLTSKGRKEMAKAHRDISAVIGVVQNSAFRVAQAATDSDKLVSPTLRKMTDSYFKLIGLNYWTNVVAQAAYNIAMDEVASYVNSNTEAAQKELADLGITPTQWREFEHDRLADDADREATLAHALKHKEVYSGLRKWVDGARLHPNPLTRTGWGNNPKYAMLWMLNDFPYTFGAVTMRRVFQQMAANPSTAGAVIQPVMTGIIFMLLGMVSLGLKEMVGRAISGEPPEQSEHALRDHMFKSAIGPGSVLGQYDRIAKLAQHVVMDYRGAPYLNVISPPVSQLLSINQRGFLPTMISGTALIPKSQKTEATQAVNEFFAPADQLQKDIKEWFQ